MVKVLRINLDHECSQWIAPVDPLFIKKGKIFFNGKPRIADWDPPKFYVYDPLQRRSNFFSGIPGALVFDEVVKRHPQVYLHLAMAGEPLPIELESGERLFILNVTQVVNTLDLTATRFERDPLTNGIMRILDYGFISERLPGSSIFKTPETCRSEVLTLTGRFPNIEDEFLSAYSESPLQGLCFEKLWEE